MRQRVASEHHYCTSDPRRPNSVQTTVGLMPIRTQSNYQTFMHTNNLTLASQSFSLLDFGDKPINKH